tara:strand:- start:537 stop:662 length:126 start_codon:yes stop_codon:yes gene_type:complete
MEIGEITTCITAAILAMAAAFCLGMYIATQIESWIKKRTKK